MAFRRGLFVISPAVCLFFLLVGLGHAQDAQPTANPDFIAGVSLVRDGQYQDAVDRLQRAATSEPKLEPAWYYLGVAQYNLGSLQEAVAAFMKALELRPNRPETRLCIGRIYEDQGAYREAADVYGEELRTRGGRDDGEVYNALTRAYFLGGDYRAATETGGQATMLDPNYVEALYNWARAEDALGRQTQAIKLLTQGKDILTKWSDMTIRLQRLTDQKRSDPEVTEEKKAQEYGRAEEFAIQLGLWPALNKALGNACLNAGRFADARNAYRDAMRPTQGGNPKDADAKTLIGIAYYREGLDLLLNQDVVFQAIDGFQAAIGGQDALKDALADDPNWAPAHNALGEIYVFESQTFISDPARGIVSHTPEEAEQELKKALEIDPQYVDAMLNLAKAYNGQLRHDEAFQQLSQALRIQPNRADLHAQLALTLVGLERYDQAREEAMTAAQLHRGQVDAYNAAGLAAYYLNDLGEAVEYFTKAIELDSTRHQSHTNLGLAFFQMRTWTRARQEFRQALKYLPQAIVTNTAYQRSYLLYLTGLTYSNTGSHAQAIQALNEALGLDPTYFDALKQLARDYAAQKDYRAAESALRRALQQSPGPTDDAEVLAQLGLVYESSGQPHQALAAYSEALTKDPNNQQAQSGFARLQSY